jgi:ferrous-iron efflux pump FieF
MSALSSASALSPAAAGVLARQAAIAAVSVAAFLVAIKVAAFFLTGSVSLLGSLIDSVLDALASLLNVLALREASQPVDREHRFGHGKAEALAGLGQSALIAGSAAFLALESIRRLIRPAPIEHGLIGIAVILVSMAATISLVWFQRRVIARTGSLAISADHLHYRGDLVLNAGVLFGLFAGGVLGVAWLDAAFGLFIALYISQSVVKILRLAYDQLMDREFDDADRAKIRAIIDAHPDVRAMHDLRTRRSGFDRFIQVHIELDPALTLLKAHAISDTVEAAIKVAFPHAEVIIHEDPAGVEDPSTLPLADSP